MPQYSNSQNLPLSIAVFLATDTYVKNEDAVSATQLIKPTRQLILDNRIPEEERVADVASMLKSRLGTAMHAGIENAWINPTNALLALGYPQKTVDKFLINPKDSDNLSGRIPVYVEQTFQRELNGYLISGSPDFIIQGNLSDFKKTTTYNYGDEALYQKYILQGSIYKWMAPHIITGETLQIIQIYDDWMKAKSFGADYPPSPVMAINLQLMSTHATERYIHDKINELEKYMDADDDQIPLCTDLDLWRKPTVYKYYKNPQRGPRSTRTTETYEEAHQAYMNDGMVGVIDEIKGQVNYCRYCSAAGICKQAQRYLESGELTL